MATFNRGYCVQFILGIILLLSESNARDIPPLFRLHASGLVSDFVVDGDRLYAATDTGSVDIFDLRIQNIVDRIVLKPIKTAQGDLVPARIHCVDRIKDKTLLVSSGKNGYRNIWIYEGFVLKKIVDEEKKLFVKEARFTDDEHIILGTFGSDSAMGNIVLSNDKKKMIMSDESGTVKLIDVASSHIDRVFSSEHVDNIYRVAYSNGVVVSAGQDRRVGIYPANSKPYHLKSDFLVYSVGLSPSAATGVYSSGVNHNLQLFDIMSRELTDHLVGHHAIVNKIVFINEHMLVSAGDENDLFFWRLN